EPERILRSRCDDFACVERSATSQCRRAANEKRSPIDVCPHVALLVYLEYHLPGGRRPRDRHGGVVRIAAGVVHIYLDSGLALTGSLPFDQGPEPLQCSAGTQGAVTRLGQPAGRPSCRLLDLPDE